MRVEQFAVIGSPETGDSGGDEQEGGDGDRDAQSQQRWQKLGRGLQRRNGCQERRDGRHEIALARTQRPAGSTNDRHVKRGKTDRRKGEIRGSNPCRRSDDREPGAFSRQGFKMLGQSADREVAVHALRPRFSLCKRRIMKTCDFCGLST